MAGKKSDNIAVERVTGMDGDVDISFDEQRGYAILSLREGNAFVEMELGGVPYIEDLIGALQRVKKKAQKTEQ
ncbi:MAG: hypothetical protein KGI70_00790 [Patescibacteria group bacterium]|nr:hypothetical protein [Patescibacteria group bacterium]